MKDFHEKTGISISAVNEILKGRTGVGNKVLNATIESFPDIVNSKSLIEGQGSLFKMPSQRSTIGKQILELAELMDKGIISKREFEAGKKKILGM